MNASTITPYPAQWWACAQRLKTLRPDAVVLTAEAAPAHARRVSRSRLLLDGLSKDGIDCLIGQMNEHTFEDRELVVAEGEIDEGLYVIKKGEASVQVRSTTALNQVSMCSAPVCAASTPLEIHTHPRPILRAASGGGPPSHLF